MSLDIFLRYVIELFLIIPALIFAVLPVKEYLKFNSLYSFIAAVILISSSIFAGAFLCTKYNLRARTVIIAFSILFFALYVASFNLSFNRKLFCALNSAMLCLMCPIFTIFIMSPLELSNMMWNTVRLLTFQSGLVCLVISFLVGVIFYKSLTVKLPLLLREERLSEVWKFLFLVPLAMALLISWSTPLSPVVVITGRVRPVAIALLLFVAGVMLFMNHIFWWTTVKLTESAKLQQENNLLQIENKRYIALKNYMNETKQ